MRRTWPSARLLLPVVVFIYSAVGATGSRRKMRREIISRKLFMKYFYGRFVCNVRNVLIREYSSRWWLGIRLFLESNETVLRLRIFVWLNYNVTKKILDCFLYFTLVRSLTFRQGCRRARIKQDKDPNYDYDDYATTSSEVYFSKRVTS